MARALPLQGRSPRFKSVCPYHPQARIYEFFTLCDFDSKSPEEIKALKKQEYLKAKELKRQQRIEEKRLQKEEKRRKRDEELAEKDKLLWEMLRPASDLNSPKEDPQSS